MTLMDAFLTANKKIEQLSPEDKEKFYQWAEAYSKPNTVSADLLKRIREEVRSDPCYPVAQEYCRQITEDVQIKPDTVEAVIAEKICWAVRLAGDAGTFLRDDDAPDARWNGGLSQVAVRQMIAPFMARAVPYVWNNNMFSLMAQAAVPRHTMSSHLPFDVVWFTFENGMEMMTVLDPEKPVGPGNIGPQWEHNIADGILAIQLAGKVRLVLLGSDLKTKIPFFQTLDLVQGDIYPDHVIPSAQLFVGAFLSCISFINSPYIVLDQHTVCRQARRRLGIQDVPESGKPRFILLRSPLFKRDYEESDSHVDWKFRWMVRGHHRSQWCPSTRSHKLMWIAPYVKGPEGMPMKVSAFKVVR